MESEEIDKRRKLSHIKVKDESIGTVVSVGQQTEKKIRKQPTPAGKIKKIQAEGSDYFSVSSANVNNESSDAKETKKYQKSSETKFTCFQCRKKFVSSNTVDNVSHVQATLTRQLIGFQSEINTCCTCNRQQNSNSKFRTEETIETSEKGKLFSRGKTSAKPISRDIVDDVTINSHVGGVYKKFHTSPGKSESSCLEKLIKNKNDHRDKNSDVKLKGKNTRLQESQSRVEYNDNLSLSKIDSDCICEKGNITSGKNLMEREKQFKMEKNRSCHCDDSD